MPGAEIFPDLKLEAYLYPRKDWSATIIKGSHSFKDRGNAADTTSLPFCAVSQGSRIFLDNGDAFRIPFTCSGGNPNTSTLPPWHNFTDPFLMGRNQCFTGPPHHRQSGRCIRLQFSRLTDPIHSTQFGIARQHKNRPASGSVARLLYDIIKNIFYAILGSEIPGGSIPRHSSNLEAAHVSLGTSYDITMLPIIFF